MGTLLTEQSTAILPTQPRARGDIVATFGCADGETRLQTLRQAGSSRALFPRSPSLFTQMVLTNTSGGVTGGDRFRTRISVADGAAVSVTTQAAERAYRAQPGQVGRVATTLEVGHGSRINWLPQETILFDGCDFARRLTVSLEPDATALLVEPLVFGRTAMGETVRSGTVDDRIEVIASGRCVFLDRMRLSGDMAGQLARPAVAGDARAGAVVVFAAHTAEARLEPLRALLPKTGGASLLQPALLVARLLSEDAFELRRSLVPVLELLHEDVMPRPWMI